MKIFSRLTKEILVADGAMGTMLQEAGLPAGALPELWNLTHPERVKSIHMAYIKAGANIITTNTFNANRARLSEFGLAKNIKQINEKAAQIALDVAKPDTIVAGSIGPSGKFLKPFGELDFDKAYKIFYEQAKYLSLAGVDVIIIETMVDILELKAAILGSMDATNLTVIAQLSFNEGIRTVTGTDTATACAVIEPMGVRIFGANCMCVEDAEKVIKIMGESTSSFLIIQPNAGTTQSKVAPTELAEFAARFVSLGANIVGSCCNSTPEHTFYIAKTVKKMTPVTRVKRKKTCIASRTNVVYIGEGEPFFTVGERINPSGKPKLEKELRKRKLGRIKAEAIRQVESGAIALDVNIGNTNHKFIANVIQELQNVVSVPLFIDSQDPITIENALKVYAGKAGVNSVTGCADLCSKILPIVKRYGAAVVGLTIDENGIPETPVERLKVAKKIIKSAKSYGIRKEDVIIDTLVLPIGTYEKSSTVAIETLRMVKKKLKVATILGISNISYGLPGREFINQSFLSAAIQNGLDAAIIDPYDTQLMGIVSAGSLLAQRDLHAKRYIETIQRLTNQQLTILPTNPLYREILLGNKELIPKLIDEVIKLGTKPIEIINEIIIPAIKEAGDRYSRKELFLPQLIAVSEAAKVAFSILTPLLPKNSDKKRVKILLATVKGDMHDLGKNLVGALLEANGWHVVDIGKDVDRDELIKACKIERPDVVGLSCLMTTAIPSLESTIKYLIEEYPLAKIIVGGACVDARIAKRLGVSYAKDAVQAVQKIKSLLF
ncbi:MAG: homocysteine S-methyltransferase family protein [bacterium]|nr:homocysteine S-methyltransferase family protein [bacterium]